MEHIAALMLIIGCSPDLAQCRELPAAVPVVFETEEECDQALPQALRTVDTQDARLFARCIEVDPAMEEMDAELVWDVTAEEGLVAFVDTSPPAGEPETPPETLVAASSGREGPASVLQR